MPALQVAQVVRAARVAPRAVRARAPGADRLGFHLMLVGRRWRQALDAELEAYGLSHASWRPLLKLACADAPLRQHELAERLQIGHPELVRLIDSLERKRLVVRHEAEGDRRAKRIRLTPGGRRLADQVAALIEAFERRILRGISLADRARCRGLLAQIEERLDRLPPVARPRSRSATASPTANPTSNPTSKPTSKPRTP
jgi:MarR family transcriptional regulator for hemolysin